MPNPLGGFLGAAAGLARQGLSANAALKLLQQAGLGIRRADFLQAYGELRQSVNAANSLLGLPLSGRPSEEQIGRFASQTASGYRHVVQFLTVNRESGEVTTSRVTVKSSSLLGKEEAEQAALGVHLEEAYREEETLIGMSLEAVNFYGPGQ